MNYLYLLICPITLDAKYVGVSINPENRLTGHIHDAGAYNGMRVKGHPKAFEKSKWINNLTSKNKKPIIAIIGQYESRKKALIEERNIITKHYDKLTNSVKT